MDYYRLRGYWLTLDDKGSFTEGAGFGDSRYSGNKQFPTLIIKRIYEKSWPEDWSKLKAELTSCFD